jgi:glycosyltransferase involved in cell wall biosynthesis
MGYAPNTDGAQWLVRDILPQLRELLPDVRVRLVGRGSDRLAVASERGVDVTGTVEDMATELARIDVAVVPLRMGGGTRIKILEAWAHQIPVVATGLGAYGLATTDEQDVLIADDAPAFARAIHRVLTDRELRDRLVANGKARAEDLTWKRISAALSPLLASLADGANAERVGSTI